MAGRVRSRRRTLVLVVGELGLAACAVVLLVAWRIENLGAAANLGQLVGVALSVLSVAVGLFVWWRASPRHSPTGEDGPAGAALRNDMSGQAHIVVQASEIHAPVTIYPPGNAAGDGPPIVVTADTRTSNHLTFSGADHLLDLPPDTPLEELPPYDRKQFIKGTLHMVDDLHVDNNQLILTVEGSTTRAVILERLRIRVLDRRSGSTPRGVLFSRLSLPYNMRVRKFLADLRSGDAVAVRPLPVRPYDTERTPDFPYVVHGTEPERFAVNLCYGDEDVEWIAELDWKFSGRSGTLRIDNVGAPFVSTAFCTRPVYKPDPSNGGWRPAENWWPSFWSKWVPQ